MRAEQERSLRGSLDRVRREMLAGRGDALSTVEVERRLQLEARRGFAHAVAEARAAGHSWEQIVRHVPGLGPEPGADAAERLFELVSVPGSRFGEHHVTWRCGSCEGLVLDRGPEAGHPVDAEPGHRAQCERLATEVSRRVASIAADDEIAPDIAAPVSDHVPELDTWARPVEVEGPGLELW